MGEFRPIRDNVLIRMLPLPETQGGIVLARSRDSVNNEPRLAEVLAVGPGVQKGRAFVPTEVKPGDVVLVPHLCGTEYDAGEYEKTKNFGESDLIDSLRLSTHRIVEESVIRGVVEMEAPFRASDWLREHAAERAGVEP
jgi:co-chaperonin GroES (HSP10)